MIRSLPRSHPRGGPEKAIEALVRHLDAFYTDPEGWLELASLYEELHMCVTDLVRGRGLDE